MPKLFIYSIICSVKRLAANNPKVLNEQFIELSMYIYTMEFYTAIKRNEKYFIMLPCNYLWNILLTKLRQGGGKCLCHTVLYHSISK